MAADCAGDDTMAGVKRRKLSFLDLPPETQQGIISHCSQTDLICLALVSKRFHELASAQLYRNFHIIFPDDDDLSFDSPIDGLAGGLDTFTTSEYDYGKHLKDLSLDTLSAGVKGEISYHPYLYSASCGKFLNTLLCLTLRKARSLETFKWNIRVELSRPVYRALHKLASLKKLHIRMQAGESYYIPPPPLPVSADTSTSGPPANWTGIPPMSPPPVPNAMPLPIFGASPPLTSGPPPAFMPLSKSLPRSKVSKDTPPAREPPTLSGFKGLKSLCILDIDDLDIVTELRACIGNSFSSLTELHLSFSESLALRARKPLFDTDADDSDAEDDFEIAPLSHSPNNDGTGPVKVFRAQEERKVQEAVLGKVLGLKDSTTKSPHPQEPDVQDSADERPEADGPTETDPREDFISSIRAVSTQLLKLLNGYGDPTPSQQEILDTIEKAARKYVDSGEVSSPQSVEAEDTYSFAEATSSTQPTPVATDTGATSEVAELSFVYDKNEGAGPSSAQSTVNYPEVASSSNSQGADSLFAEYDDLGLHHIESRDNTSKDLRAQTIDTQEAIQSAGFSSSESSEPSIFTASTSTMAPELASENVVSDLANLKMRHEGLLAEYKRCQDHILQLRAKINELKHGSTWMSNGYLGQLCNELHAVEATAANVEQMHNASRIEIDALEKLVTPKSRKASVEIVQRCMNDYIHQTRGFSLDTLSVYLVPVKASVLSRTINLRALRSLTLLNVGNQAPIWTLLAKENKICSLPLRSVYTDNVSSAFLTCMSQLDELHELLMLERSPKYKPESFASRTTVTIGQIRRLVLSKHLPTLKRLMIRDDSSTSSWDVNIKTIVRICRLGKQLEELGVSMDIHAVHAFMQYIPGLVSLRAIHIIHFRNNDTCIWVMRELVRFMVDNLSHRPGLKVEWIAVAEDRVDRIVRNSDAGDKHSRDGSNKLKGKSKATTTVSGSNSTNAEYPVLPSIPVESESESEEDGFDSGSQLRYKTIGPMQFHDVWGVKIFEKEIRTGRL